MTWPSIIRKLAPMLAVLAIAAAAYQAGRWAKGADVRAERAEERLNTIEQREVLKDDVENIPDDGLRERLDSLWP